MTKNTAAARRRGARADVPVTKDAIVAAAFRLIDERGLEGFSMRSLASELGVFPATLYWHVGDRGALLGLVEYEWIKQVRMPDPDTNWRTWALEVARGYRAHAFRHPNIARLATLERPQSAESLRIPDALIGKLVELGFDDDLVDAFNALMGAIRGFVIVELAPRPESIGPDEIEVEIRGLDASEYPNIVANVDRLADRALSLRWSNPTDRPLDESFDFLVNLLLDGLEARRRP